MRLIRIVDQKLEEYVCVVLLSLLTILLCAQVFMRFVMGTGLSWGEELSRFVFVWLMYLAASLGVRRKGHIRVTTFVDFLPQRMRRIVSIISDILWLIFSIWIVILSIGMLKVMFQYPQLSPALLINTAWAYLIIPISFGMMGFRLLQLYYQEFKGRRGGNVDVPRKK